MTLPGNPSDRRNVPVWRAVADRIPLLRLPAPLSADPTARILNALLLAVLAWVAAYLPIVFPRYTVRHAAAAGLLAILAGSSAAALVLLRHCALRKSAAVFLSGLCLAATLLVFFNGGINSPGLVLYASVPISAAWLLGQRAAIAFCCASLLCSLAMTAAEMAGYPPPRYFTGTPFGIWAVFVLATVVAVIPLMVVLRTLKESLAAAERWIQELHDTQAALRRERDLAQRVMETSPVGILAADRTGQIAFLNSSGERILGVGRDEARQRAYNDPSWRATAPDGSPYPDDELPFRQVQQHRGTLNDVRMMIARPDGRKVLLSINAAPILTADGKFDGMVSTLQDMTESARLDEELRKYREGLEDMVRRRTEELVAARDQAMAANQAKSVFLANMSHELRTPLNAILGLSTLVSESGEISPDQLRKIRMIRRSGEHLLDLINDVLDLARIEAGGVRVANVLTDLEDLALGVVEMMREKAEAKGLKVFLDRAPSCPRFVFTDPAKVRQMLMNLLSNAIKFTTEGHVSLRIDAEVGEQPALRFDITDTGMGIAADDRERIFQSFVQAGEQSEGGAGLGLSITRQYVERMGGSITVESSPGHGSRFRMRIPAAIADGGSAIPPMERGSATVLEPGQRQWRILIVEDQRENRIVLHQLLSNAGFPVKVVEDGAAALAAFRKWRPDFIWMDWRLPVMNGESATRAIRRMAGGGDVKIAAVTASVFAADRERILATGVDEVVHKPFRPQEIFDCMTRLLGARFVHADRATAGDAGSALSPAALASLPDALRAELEQALLSLDPSRVAEAVRKAAEVDRDLGERLGSLADSLEFTVILRALRSPEKAKGAR